MRGMVTLAALAGGTVAAYKLAVEPWWKSWGIDPTEQAMPLAGDEIVPGAATTETRAITIDAPPSAVWPLIVQMGFGRAGWYSYDQVDMRGRSATTLLPEHQSLAIGDVVPTHPGGGFVVRALEPERHLVLSLDSETVREQMREARAANAESPANLRMTGAVLEGGQPAEFEASWAFVLEAMPSERTRLVERFRVRFGSPEEKPWTRMTLPMMGFGVFLMMRKQLLGIRERAERGPDLAPAVA